MPRIADAAAVGGTRATRGEPTLTVQYGADDLDVRVWAAQYVRHVLAVTSVPVFREHPL
ncbi:MAG TPA: hypothetical protein VFW04_02230 [Gemmatimonadaceae bacterium]|nr:hypothetical protein [Gemmatimonadaceae bacterium]